MHEEKHLFIAYKCLSAIGTSLQLAPMMTHFLSAFSSHTNALSGAYWEYNAHSETYECSCYYGKALCKRLFTPPCLKLEDNSITVIKEYSKTLLHVKIDNDWIVFLFESESIDIELIKKIISDFKLKLENAILACKNYHELREINATLEKRIDEEVSKNRDKDKHILQQSRLAQMGEMISMIAHQWRQPLGSISTVAASLKLKMVLNRFDLNSQEGKEAQKQFIAEAMGKIEGYIQFLTHTIDDFRNFFKPDKQKESVTLLSLVNRTLEIIGKALEINGIMVNISNNTKESILSYPSELTQVILNILKNAEDAFKETKKSNATINISIEKKGTWHILCIEDNAGGIPESVLPHVFEPYYSTKKEKNGTGLGLYMSKIIIEEHCHGKISVSNSTNGACFLIELQEN